MTNAQETRRWGRGGYTAPEEARAAELFAAARELPPVPLEVFARAEAGVSAQLAGPGLMARWAKVLFASAAIGGGSLAYAAWSRGSQPEQVEPATPPREIAAASPLATTPTEQAIALQQDESLRRAAPSAAAPTLPKPSRVRPRDLRPPSSEAAAVPAAGGLAREASLLQEALRNLRAEDPAGALEALDARAREFPNGQLAAEANVARIDALVAAGRRGDALDLLEGWGELEDLPRAAELELLRAELRAEAGRCRAALETFETTIVRGTKGALLERAWRGRVRCRSALGDRLGAKRDAAEYLRRFPTSTRSDEMRAIVAP